MRAYFSLLISISAIANSLASDAQEGYAVIKNDTIYGKIIINFESGSVFINQDAVNRMFLTDIEVVTLFNDSRDTYYTFTIDKKTRFFKAVVAGENPLIEKDDVLYCVIDDYPTVIVSKTLYQIFGKKEVKNYTFVRNISLEEKSGLIDLFRYFNHYNDF